jgi:hypothetical protein
MSEIYPQYSKDLTEKTARICELALELEASKERIAKLEAALREWVDVCPFANWRHEDMHDETINHLLAQTREALKP